MEINERVAKAEQRDDAFTGKIGEPTWDTDTNQLRIHDGQTVGGHKETEHDWNKILQAAVGRV